jgi:hypothetical protein
MRDLDGGLFCNDFLINAGNDARTDQLSSEIVLGSGEEKIGGCL